MNARLISTALGDSAAAQRVVEEFREAIASTGLVPPGRIDADGNLHRFHVAGDKSGSRNAWYVLHVGGHPAGAFGSWKVGVTHTWSSDQTTISAARRRRLARLIEAAKEKERAKRQDEQAARAVEAQQQWELGLDPDPHHPYLLAKAVRPHALRQHGVVLLVPLVGSYHSSMNISVSGTSRASFRTAASCSIAVAQGACSARSAVSNSPANCSSARAGPPAVRCTTSPVTPSCAR